MLIQFRYSKWLSVYQMTKLVAQNCNTQIAELVAQNCNTPAWPEWWRLYAWAAVNRHCKAMHAKLSILFLDTFTTHYYSCVSCNFFYGRKTTHRKILFNLSVLVAHRKIWIKLSVFTEHTGKKLAHRVIKLISLCALYFFYRMTHRLIGLSFDATKVSCPDVLAPK